MVSIEPIKIQDLKELAKLYRQLAGKKTGGRRMKQNFEWMQSNPDYLVLGAKSEGKLMGSLMAVVCHDLVGECRPFMVVENVIVSRGHRRQGIGRRLMRTVERIARQRHCYYIMFVSKSRRTDAHRFYESLGYRLDVVQGFKKVL
jgi:GNAT superfamily N-acetyltransferase